MDIRKVVRKEGSSKWFWGLSVINEGSDGGYSVDGYESTKTAAEERAAAFEKEARGGVSQMKAYIEYQDQQLTPEEYLAVINA